jgi:hypothetical protein
LQELNPIKGQVFDFDGAATNFEGMEDNRLRLGFEFEVQLRELLH